MPRVFISYRRDDSGHVVDKIYARLVARLGEGNVFRDVDKIASGANFPEVLADALGRCDVLLAVIGPGWLGAADDAGRRRLDSEDDWVRREVAGGLGRNIHVIPVLVEGAGMPRESELPAGLELLASFNAARLRPGPDLDADLGLLLRDLEDPPKQVFADEPPPSARDGFAARLLASLWPRLHLLLVRRGLFRRPPELNVVHNYLSYFAGQMEKLNRVVRYVPLGGTERPGAAAPESEYAPRRTRAEELSTIRRTVRLLSGLHAGGDQATARLASANRTSRVVRNVARLLRKRTEPVILLGDPGSGKSMTLREVGLSIARQGLRRARPPVVVYVRLGHYHAARGDRPGEVWELIKQHVPKEHVNVRGLMPFLEREGRLVILFDGMDEMERRLYGARVSLLSDFARNHEGTVKTLFACRTNDFNPKFIHRQLVLLEFDEGQVRDYLRRNLGPRGVRIGGEVFAPARLARHLLADTEWHETARNPLTLYLLCLFLAERHAWPQTRHALFENYLRALFRRIRDAADRPLPDDAWPAIFDGWARLAFRITSRNAGISVGLDELREDWDENSVRAVIDSGRGSGLLVFDEFDEQSVRFMHHRMQEYLTACHLDAAGAGQAGVDWASLIDTPRWQEVLINLSSIQQERSAALRVVLESMQSVVELRAGESRVGGSPWGLPAAEESLLAGRVVLASRVIRELGQNPSKLPPRFLDTFRESITRLAAEGRPTTQVRMLWAWSNAADVCPLSALDVPLNSEVEWVREQALSVVGGNVGRARVDVDLRRELVIDLTSGRLLRRLGAYRKAIVRAGDRRLYGVLAWAVVCRLAFVGGLLGLFYGACWVALSAWPLPRGVERLLSGLGRGWHALALLGISVSAAGLVRRLAGADFWRRTLYACAGCCATLLLLERLAAGEDFILFMAKAAVAGGILLGLLWCGAQGLFWGTFYLYLLPSFGNGDRERHLTARRLARKNSATPNDALDLRTAGICLGILVGFYVLRLLARLFSTHVAAPAQARFGDYLDAIPILFVSSIGLLILYAMRSLPGRARAALKGVWERDGPPGTGSWRVSSGLLARWAGRRLWDLLRAAPPALGKVLLFFGGLLLITFAVAAPFVLLMKGLEWFGVDSDRRGQLPELMLSLALASLLTLGVGSALWQSWVLLRRRLPGRRQRQALVGMPVAEWVRRVTQADPETQAWYFRATSPYTLGVEADAFLRVLESLEAHVAPEPAASEYWKSRHNLEEIVRQERLASFSEQAAQPDGANGEARPAETRARPFAPPDVTAPAAAPGRPSKLTRYLRRALLVFLPLAVACASLNEYVKRHRAVYIVNGLPAQVEVVVDGAETFQLGPRSARRHFVAEGLHTVVYRRPQGEPRTQQFELTSPGFLQRLFDDDLYVLNLGGNAVLRYANRFVKYADGVRPDRAFYSSRRYIRVRNAARVFDDEQAPGRAAAGLQFSPDLPAHLFSRLSDDYTEEEAFDLAERHLQSDPGNTLLLQAYTDFAFRRGRAARCRDFLLAQVEGDRPLPADWYHRWQAVTVRLEGPEALPGVWRKLEEIFERHGQNRSELSCLRASMEASLSEALKHYDEALKAEPGNPHTRFGMCSVRESAGDLPWAKEECLAAELSSLASLGINADPDKPYMYAENLEVASRDRARRSALFNDLSAKLLDLNLALRDTDGVTRELGELRQVFGDEHAAHAYALALDLLEGGPDRARARHRLYAEERAEGVAASAATLHYLLGEFEEQARAAADIPDPQAAAAALSYALLELKRYEEAERQHPATYPEEKGLFYLLVSVGRGAEGGRQPDEMWLRAGREFRASRLPSEVAVAGLLASGSAPRLEEVLDLNLPPAAKATVLVALAQRFPSVRAEAARAAGNLAHTHWPPGHLLRRAARGGRGGAATLTAPAAPDP